LAERNKEEKAKIDIKLESLTDMVFGLALSIGALLLAISNSSTISDIEFNVLSFGFNFLVLIFVWIHYTSIVSVLPENMRKKRSVFYLNVLLLFFVALEPYLFNILHISTTQALAAFGSSVYAIDLGVITLILWIFIQLLVMEYKRTSKKKMPAVGYKYIYSSSLLMAFIFFASAIPIFWYTQIYGVPIRFIIWAVPVPLMLIARSNRKKNPATKQVT
jgi:hypothetical protein